MKLDLSTVFAIVLFVLPGFLSYITANSLHIKSTESKDIEITYKSLLYSSFLFLIVYIFSNIFKVDIKEAITETPLYISLAVILLSMVFGIVVYLVTINQLLYKFLVYLRLAKKVEPPNIYATLLDPKYAPQAENGIWVTFWKGDSFFEGYIGFTDLANEIKLIYLKDIIEFDDKGNVKNAYSEDYGMIVNMSEIEGIYIYYN